MKLKGQKNITMVPALRKPIKVKRKTTDSKEESAVSKALKNVKKVLEKKKESVPTKEASKLKPKKLRPFRKFKHTERKPKFERGIVYLGHIPHGFYEEQIEDYFKQFGTVTRVRVARSRKTGNSRGYGYIQFALPEVAKIAAETMNNYLMCGRLLKATYIPPDKQHIGYFQGAEWSKQSYPKLNNRQLSVEQKNAISKEKNHEAFVQRTQHKLSSLEKNLQQKGIKINFQKLPVQQS